MALTRRSSIDAFEAATDLARRLHAECYYLPGPIVCDSEAGRDTLVQQPMMREVHAKAEAADIALVSVGGVDSGTMRRSGMVTDAEYREVTALGAIGNFLGYYVDGDARIIDHPVNRRVIGFHPREFVKVPRRIMVSGGPAKAPVLRALLKNGYVTGLVTDDATAARLLDGSG